MLQIQFQLSCEFKEISDQPEEVGGVYSNRTGRGQELNVEDFNEGTVSLEQKVHCELLQDVGDVLAAGHMVGHGFDVDTKIESFWENVLLLKRLTIAQVLVFKNLKSF